MDYLKLLNGLKKEFLEAGKEKYESLFILWRLLLTIIFIPLRVSFFFARLGFWFTWFFFKCLATPVDYLQKWLNTQQNGIHPAAQAVLYFCCIPTIFYAAGPAGFHRLCILLPVVWPYDQRIYHDPGCGQMAARDQRSHL